MKKSMILIFREKKTPTIYGFNLRIGTGAIYILALNKSLSLKITIKYK